MAVTSRVNPGPGPKNAVARGRLAGIDGLRAVAALWVVVFNGILASHFNLPNVPGFSQVAGSGWKGVSLFFVLSGFCLYLPLAQRPALPLDVRRFFKRRALRILPAYYVSLAGVAVLHLALERRLGSTQLGLEGTLLHTLAHATMLHSVIPAAFNSLNGVYWSLGIEWQLYLAFPLLVYLSARWGAPAIAAFAGVVSVSWAAGLYLAFGHGLLADTSNLWTVLANQLPGRCFEFALGMLAATLVSRRWVVLPRNAWLAAPLALLLAMLAGGPFSNVMTGILFFVVVLVVASESNPMARLMSWRPIVLLGTVSFSLYLIHEPILNTVARLARLEGLGTAATFLALVSTLPLVLAATVALYLLAERPFLGRGSNLAPETRVALATE